MLSINFTNAETSEQYRFNSNQNTICLYKIPVSIARADLIDTINNKLTQECDPVDLSAYDMKFIESLSFSDPLKLYDYVRYAYVKFISLEYY